MSAVNKKRRLIIMDEVDGMGGSDRGGIAELTKIIKASRVPIICICNDRQSPKIRGLANHCYDLRVRRPTKTAIAQRLVAIAQKEGLEASNPSLCCAFVDTLISTFLSVDGTQCG